jgi:hypothetical protein
MIIRDIKFIENAANGTLREDYEENLIGMAENLAICMAELRKWEAFKHVAAQALTEGMTLLGIAKLTADNHTFTLNENGLQVDCEMRSVH